jgi:hypothetical protein
MLCGVKVQYAPPIVAQDDEYKKDPERGCEYGKEIKRNEFFGVVFKEGSPAPADGVALISAFEAEFPAI